ncbi:MAG: UvrD-helicase domain-containing protein [Synergistaceae bacterium]|jgi:ATP-dependent exoDNAse (exonuclease V) beta subunit|nr:UvrD-helicase domain-containing protein [Synergistaceae bacterium]
MANQAESAPAAPDILTKLLSDEREEQRQAITSEAALTVVSAGAGTGKTHTLARRFAWLLASDPDCELSQILTLTFTNLAADEMRDRIRDTLVKWLKACPIGLAHLGRAIDRMDEAYISTIHAFALRVIRESGLGLDIDPGSRLVGDAAVREFWEGYKQDIRTAAPERISRGLPGEWRALAGELTSSRSYVAFLNYFGAGTLVSLARDASDVFGSMNELPEGMAAVTAGREEAARRRLVGMLSGRWQEVCDAWWGEVFPAIGGELESVSGTFADKLRGLRSRWPEAPSDPAGAALFTSDLMGGALSRIPGKSTLKGQIEDALGMKLTDWKKGFADAALISESLFARPPYEPSEAEARKMLITSAAIGWENWDSARRQAGWLTFSDLVRYATRALASGACSGRFKHVLVDEFQDTDGLQNDMIKALASQGDAPSVFLVGDIKQSIYRFRHAEPRLFASYMERPGAINIPLSCSYRMSGAMMGAINAVFSHIWADGVISPDGGGITAAPGYEPLLAPTDAPWWGLRDLKRATGAPQPLEIILYADDDDGPEDGEAPPRKPAIAEKRRKLAACLAGRLNGMVSGKDEIWGKAEEAFRPVKYGDIAILVPGRTFYGVLEEALQEAGIPAVFESGMDYFRRGEVRDMINLLRALDDPGDDYALAGWAESPFSGLPPGASLELMAQSPGSLWQLLSELFPDAAARFMKLRRRARMAGPSAAMLSLIEDDSWLAAYKPAQRGRVLAHVLRGVEVARDYEAYFGRNLSACADYLGRAMRGGFQADEPKSPEEGDFVRVMTVHASKGQEFPVVALMGMESPVRPKVTARASVSRHIGVVARALPCVDCDASPGETLESVTAKWHDILERAEEREEKERLLYVAMTRAKDKLICCGVQGPGASLESDNWLGWLLQANEKSGRPFAISHANGFEPAAPESHDMEATGPLRRATQMAAAFPAVSLAGLSATAYSLYMWCPAAYRAKYRQGRELKWELPDGDGYGGADLGSLAHWALAKWDFTAEGLERLLPPGGMPRSALEAIKRGLPSFLRPVFASSRNRDALRSWLFAFAATDECAALRELDGEGMLCKELSFVVPFKGVRLAGSIDLFWEDNSGTHVRDWKITQVERAPDELYREQVNFYSAVCKIAAGLVSGKAVRTIDAGLIYLRPGNESGVCELLDPDGLDETAQSIEMVIKAAVSGPFSPRRDRCPRCPFRHDCAF